MKIVRRLLANLIDISLFLGLIVTSFIYILPFLLSIFRMDESTMILVGCILIFIGVLYFCMQYPFMKVNQTIGKAFFGLRIQTTNPSRPMTVSVIVQREIFAKVMSCYSLCIPVLFGSEGKHDEACETEVI